MYKVVLFLLLKINTGLFISIINRLMYKIRLKDIHHL